jgi:predicted acetyltransferase
MPFEIRVNPFGNVREWGNVTIAAFGETVDEAETADNERLFEADRRLGAFDGDVCVGTAGAFSHRLTIPGGEVASCGVTAVGVIPTYRRRGVLTELMRYQLDDAVTRGEPVAALFASEGAIYGRYGYGMATFFGSWQLERTRSAFRDPVQPEGVIRAIDLDGAKRLFPPVYELLRATWPGFYNRTEAWWDVEVLNDRERRRRGASPAYRVVHEAEGQVEGYAIYRLKPEWDDRGPKGEMRVQELMATTPRAERALWRHVFDVDLMATTRAWGQPPDHPLFHLLAEPRRMGFQILDGLYVRLLDLPGALEPRSYGTADDLTLDLRDEFLPANAGRWRLEAWPDGAHVERTNRAPDLAFDVATLGALYLGGWHAGSLAAAGRIEEHTPGAVTRLDALFRTPRAPWCPQIF